MEEDTESLFGVAGPSRSSNNSSGSRSKERPKVKLVPGPQFNSIPGFHVWVAVKADDDDDEPFSLTLLSEIQQESTNDDDDDDNESISLTPLREIQLESRSKSTQTEKTLANAGIQAEENESVVPTVGFSATEIKHAKFKVTVFDLGGGRNIRAIWSNYFALVHGIIFVVDSSDALRLHEGKEVIEEVIKDKRISGKPILLLVNKQDIEGALNEAELCSSLHLEEMVNEYRCPTRVENCTALVNSPGMEKHRDSGIEMGFNWILQYIDKNFTELNLKVQKEMDEQKIAEEIERKERLERVRKIREEREKLNGIEEVANDDHGIEENPFRPLEEITGSFPLKDSALRKSSVGANGKKEILTEVILHTETEQKARINIKMDSLQEQSPKHIDKKDQNVLESPAKDPSKKKNKKKTLQK